MALSTDVFGRFSRPPGGDAAPGGWWILAEPGLHRGEDALAADATGWRRERLPKIPSAVGITLAPDWVCEVVSPSSRGIDRNPEIPLYAREGVAHMWIVRPLLLTLELHRLEAGRWIVAANHGGDDRVRAEPFDAVELDLARWWIDTA